MSDVDLSDLNFMPDWLKEPSSPPKPPREYSDTERPPRGKGGKGSGGFKGKGGGGRGGDNRGGGGRGGDNRGSGGGYRGGGGGGGRDDRGAGFKGKGGGGYKGKGGPRGRDNRGGDRDRRPAFTPAPEGITAEVRPGDAGVKQIAEQIKKTARAYSVFDIARAVVSGRERYSIVFKRDKPDAPELFVCKADSSAWLSRTEAITQLGTTNAFSEHYDEETIEGEAPTGNYTAIAVCGFSGKCIGPPNHHTYQSTIAKLHRDKFSNMSLDRYKQRIRVERDEETIEKWKKEQSVQQHYTYKKAAEGEEAPKFTSRETAERHFMETHGDQLVSTANEVAVSGNIPGRALSPGLLTLVKNVSENARKHPASLVQPLCGMLGSEGLKFFKRGRKIFACLTRPKPLTDDAGLSKPILSIVEHLRETKKATVETILDALAPSETKLEPATAEEPAKAPEPAAAPPAVAQTKAHTLWIQRDTTAPSATVSAEAEPAKPAAPALTGPQIKVLQDLRWLLYEGAAIAFGDGHIELATPKPPNEQQQQQPKKKSAKKKAPKAKRPRLGAHSLWCKPRRPKQPAAAPKPEQKAPEAKPAQSAPEPKPATPPKSKAHSLWIKS